MATTEFKVPNKAQSSRQAHCQQWGRRVGTEADLVETLRVRRRRHHKGGMVDGTTLHHLYLSPIYVVLSFDKNISYLGPSVANQLIYGHPQLPDLLLQQLMVASE